MTPRADGSPGPGPSGPATGDGSSLRWLDHMVRRLEGLPLMLAVATRQPEQSEHGGLLTELLMDPAAVVLRPGMLRVESVPILAQDVFLDEPDEVFCKACHEATGGNPLYLLALLITLAVDGANEELSNKEIAQSLFVTVKTVEVHLSNVYRKLEIGSRRELPAALVQEHAVASGSPA